MKLKECVFSDIYMSTRDPRNPVIRGLSYREEGGALSQNFGVGSPPEPLLVDIRGLLASTVREHKVNRQDEFVIVYDSVRYRCAKITPPLGFSGRQPTDMHQDWCLRRVSQEVRPFEDLSFNAYLRRQMNAFAHRRGLVLVCGSFGSGKTTTASSLFVHWVNNHKEVGVSMEDPPEVNLSRMGSDGTIFQLDLTETSTEEAIKKLRRWNARYVFLGEIRTSEAAQELLQISQSGPLVVSTIHASTPVSAITALVRFAASRMSENDSRDLIARTLQGVIYQSFENGRFTTQYLSVGEKEDFGIRTKIRLGDFQRIDEALEHQEKNRPDR